MARKTSKPETTEPKRDPRSGKGPFYDTEIVDEQAKKIDAISLAMWNLLGEKGLDGDVKKRIEKAARATFVSAIYQQKAAAKK